MQFFLGALRVNFTSYYKRHANNNNNNNNKIDFWNTVKLNRSNTDGSFTMANSNLFLSPYEILLIAPETKY